MQSVVDRLMARVVINEHGCWIREGASAGAGYSVLSVDGEQCYAHRVSFEEFVGPLIDGMEICHTCDVFSDDWRRCINPEHLFQGTKSDNMQDAAEKGRLASGARHKRPCAKLTPELVMEIRTSPLSNRKAAKEFAVANSTISKVRTHYLWAHVA